MYRTEGVGNNTTNGRQSGIEHQLLHQFRLFSPWPVSLARRVLAFKVLESNFLVAWAVDGVCLVEIREVSLRVALEYSDALGESGG